MNNSFLNYYKLVLERVSFSEHLLIKEYNKAAKVLDVAELRDLDEWMTSNRLSTNLNTILELGRVSTETT